MTPEQRKQSEGDLLDEYKESVACLHLLNHRLHESLRVIAVSFSGFDREYDPEPVSEQVLGHADGLRELVEDYRETYDRCIALRAALSEWASVIAELPHPRR